MRKGRTFFAPGEFDSPSRPASAPPVKLPDFFEPIPAASLDPALPSQTRWVSIAFDSVQPVDPIHQSFSLNTPIAQIRELIYERAARYIIPGDPLLKVFYLNSPGQPFTPDMAGQQLQPTDTLEDVLKKRDILEGAEHDPDGQVIWLMASVSR
jgi:hypothetical protein